MKYSTNAIRRWEANFNIKNLKGIIDSYSPKAVFLGTFAKNIKQGRELISTYFVNLFKKDGLKVVFEPKIYVNELEDGYIISGIYVFEYKENGELKKVKSRYSFTCEYIGGILYIVNHHSSVVPMQ